MPNEAEGKKGHAFGKAIKLQCEGKDIKVSHGDSHPIAADWDKDGKLDLLVGTGAGSVMFYRSIGKDKTGAPQLAAGQTLVGAPKRQFDKAPGPQDWGIRAKICVADWNGDGWPDLLLGDFNSFTTPPPKLTDEDKKAQKEALAKQQEIFKDYVPLVQEQFKLQKPTPGESDEARAEREKRLRELAKQLQPIQEKLTEVQKELQRFAPEFRYQGNVWLFLRRPPEAKSPRGENANR